MSMKRKSKSFLLAGNPALRSLTQTMSIFGNAARTAMSITNASNLAILATSGQSNKVAQLRQDLVELDRQKMRAKTSRKTLQQSEKHSTEHSLFSQTELWLTSPILSLEN